MQKNSIYVGHHFIHRRQIFWRTDFSRLRTKNNNITLTCCVITRLHLCMTVIKLYDYVNNNTIWCIPVRSHHCSAKSDDNDDNINSSCAVSAKAVKFQLVQIHHCTCRGSFQIGEWFITHKCKQNWWVF